MSEGRAGASDGRVRSVLPCKFVRRYVPELFEHVDDVPLTSRERAINGRRMAAEVIDVAGR